MQRTFAEPPRDREELRAPVASVTEGTTRHLGVEALPRHLDGERRLTKRQLGLRSGVPKNLPMHCGCLSERSRRMGRLRRASSGLSRQHAEHF